jgi:SAM-dependent methyltransferase
MNEIYCPLCNSMSHRFSEYRSKEYLQCSLCSGIFLNRIHLPSNSEELARYHEHNNDVNDPAYQRSVQPVVTAILNDFSKTAQGLDFGAGTGPVISAMLGNEQYRIQQYDPFFFKMDLRGLQYDYIVCSEVIEHFHHPAREFTLLKKLLKKGGKIYIKTALYSRDIDFEKWYYKNDQTHVFFYTEKTMHFIRTSYGFSDLEIAGNVIILSG